MSEILKKAVSDLNKIYGIGTVRSFTEEDKIIVNSISSGSYGLNHILGVGGYPEGRIIEIYGPESSGKTTLALHAVSEAQIKYPDKKCVYIDMEHAMDPTYAENIGVNIQEWLFAQPNSGEEALEIAEKLILTKEISIVVVDSVAALIPQAELDGDYGDSKVGLQARLMSQAMRKLNGIVSKSNTILIFINQLREKIGIMFGNPETTTGGNALKFYASIRLDVRRIGSNKSKNEIEILGNKTKIKVVKNKVAPPFKICELDITFGIGIDKIAEIFDYAVEYKIIKQEGENFSYKEIKLGTNKEQVVNLLRDNDEVVIELKKKIEINLGLIELTEEEKIQYFNEEKQRQWDLFENRIIESIEKYKMNGTEYVKNIREGEFLEVKNEEELNEWVKKYKLITIYGFSQEIKKYNINNNIK